MTLHTYKLLCSSKIDKKLLLVKQTEVKKSKKKSTESSVL